MTLLLNIIYLLLIFIMIRFILKYIEIFTVIFCIGFFEAKKNKVIDKNYDMFDTVIMCAFSIILSGFILILSLKLLLTIIGFGIILGCIRSYGINKFS